jgi:DnaJ-class molecular chaperone
VVDYYELLGVDDVASSVEIKAAYRSLAKVCHVDIVGDNKGNREMCILLNEVRGQGGRGGRKGGG